MCGGVTDAVVEAVSPVEFAWESGLSAFELSTGVE